MMRRPTIALAAVLAAAAVLAGCGDDGSSGDASTAPGATGSASAASGSITVFAAASLTESFTQLGKQFEQANPAAEVTFSFGPSSGLAQQITQGAPADVFASASAKNMTQVVDAKAAASPSTFARNSMEIAVPPANPAKIATVADLAKPGVKVALCAPEVPCGTVARQVFQNANVTVTPVTNEADVKATLTKVQLGEVDAGVVYVTDVKAAGAKVTGVPIPADVNASTSYPIAPLTAGRNAALAKAFVDYVLSDDGAAVLASSGFGKP
jgi:molybdate transport system substrate-binding protein